MLDETTTTDDTASSTDNKQTWAKLAMRLQVSITAIKAWRKLHGAPTEPNYEEWLRFKEERDLGVVGNRVGGKRETLLEQTLERKNRLLDLEIAERERKTIDRDSVNALLLRLGSLQKTVLIQKLEKEMPAKAAAHGAPAAEMALLGRETADALCDIFTQEMEKWQEGV